LSDEELDEKCDNCISLFQYLTDKDMFVEVYKRQLGNRLLLKTSSSDFIENKVIRKLKIKCGPHFTMKLEGMMTDLELAKETDNKFQNSLNNNKCIPTTTQTQSYLKLTKNLKIYLMKYGK
jgi:cullin 1